MHGAVAVQKNIDKNITSRWIQNEYANMHLVLLIRLALYLLKIAYLNM